MIMGQCLFLPVISKGVTQKMTDKELRKLSRLELLELLLEASKENKKLREKINALKAENKTAQNIENLSVITGQVENALRYANSLTDTLKTTSGTIVTRGYSVKKDSIVKPSETRMKSDSLSDVEIYKRMLHFFAKNDDKLNVFPDDIGNDVRARIRSILERKKSN